ncbi:MAG: hypothetical protein RBT15_02355 [Gudongella sp.]|jgi:flagellar biosynthesis protein FlhF|nr:hypothetical protein [Gudongella sp.]
MIIRKYLVEDMKEAVTRAKYELGPEAVIVTQRDVRVRKWYNPFGYKRIEVTFALEERPQAVKEEPEKELTQIAYTGTVKEEEPQVSVEDDPLYKYAGAQIRKRLESYLKLHDKEGGKLTRQESRDFFRIILKGTAFGGTPAANRINILIGPTGVGKTTTIAKLAASQRLGYGRKVGLITLDTYRIGAVEQLKTYAGILDLPFHVVNTNEEIGEKLSLLENCDTVFIDTLGTSPRDIKKLVDLKKTLVEIESDSTTYLVASLSTDREILDSIMERYRLLRYDAMVLTKLDEAENTKNLWHLIENNKVPVHYFTHGQEVPDDIKEANSDNLFDYIEENFGYDGSSWKIKRDS